MRYKIFLFLLGFLFFINLVSAVTCNPSFVTTNYNFGSSSIQSIFCNNSGNFSVTISTSGNYFNISDAIIGQSSSKPIYITFFSTAPVGTHSGSILFSDNSTLIPVLFIVSSLSQNQTPSDILVFPTSKIITIKQGDEKTQNIQVTVPSSYPRTITILSVDMNPNIEPIRFSDLNLGQVAPGQSINIPIVFSGIGASIGTYQTQLNFLVTDSQGQVNMPSVNLQVQVSAGINPITNFSLTDLPTCSLSAIELNLNGSYSLTCSRNNPNIDIHPIIDNFYLQGISAQTTSTQYIYNFKALKIGNTVFKANYIYQNAPIGTPFNQEVRISASGNNPIPGTTLNFILYQGGVKKEVSSLREGELIIQLEDNQTKSLVENKKLYLGGQEINNSLVIKSGQNYELRATSPGYLDALLNFNVSSIPSIITLSPNQQSYILGQTINITTDSNATLYIDGVQITSPYLFTTTGIRVLKASKEGYVDTFMNITVNQVVSVNIISPEFKDWSKNDDITMKLSSSGIWNVTFEKLNEDDTYSSTINLATGVGDEVKFKLNDYGRYNVYMDNGLVNNYLLEKKGLTQWVENNWLWLVLGTVVIFLGWFLFFKGKGGSGTESVEVGY